MPSACCERSVVIQDENPRRAISQVTNLNPSPFTQLASGPAGGPPLRFCKGGDEAAGHGFSSGWSTYSDWAFMYDRKMALMRVW